MLRTRHSHSVLTWTLPLFQAYGKLLGTLLVSTLIPSFLSFAPIRVLKKV
jgi:hypothetical protein